MKDDFPELFTITFRAKPAPIPAAIRVRHLLKHALRAWDLRCVRIVPAVGDVEEPQRLDEGHDR